jgi:plastocyanin
LSNRLRTGLVLSIVALLAVALLALSTGAVAAFKVKVGDDFFSPDKATISAGSGDHNVVKKRGPGGPFASGTTDDPGVNFKKKFKKPGTYKLICSVHDEMKMKLTVKN